MDKAYFVESCFHNAKTDAWNYKLTKMFTGDGNPELALQQAEKEMCNVMNTYMFYGDLDHVGCIIWDCYGNNMGSKYWHKLGTEEPVEEE